MKRKSHLRLWPTYIVFFLSICACKTSSEEKKREQCDFYEANFESSFGRDRLSSKYFQKHPIDRITIEAFSQNWKTNVPSKIDVLQAPRIPKIFHFVWLDERPLPVCTKQWKKSWIQNHPHWQICLWHKKDITILPQEIQKAIESASSIPEQEALFASYVLDVFGGVYVDLGFECLKPLTPLVDRYSFFSGFEPPLEKEKAHRIFHISPTIIGAKPKHPIIQSWQKALCEEISDRTKNDISPRFTKKKDIKFAYLFLFEDVVYDYFQKNHNGSELIMPPTYFFPIHHKRMKKFEANPKAYHIDFWSSLGWSKKPLFSQLKPESMAIHHLGGSFEKNIHKVAKHIENKQLKKEKKIQKILMNQEQLQKASEAETVLCQFE